MILQLDEYYRIEGDKNSFILYYEKSNGIQTTGLHIGKETKSKDEWNYSNIKHALERYLSSGVSECNSAEEILTKYESVVSIIKQIPTIYVECDRRVEPEQRTIKPKRKSRKVKT